MKKILNSFKTLLTKNFFATPSLLKPDYVCKEAQCQHTYKENITENPYEMQRDDRKITVFHELESIVVYENVFRLGLYDEELQNVHIVPLNYGYKAGKFYFHSSPEGLKLKLIEQNPKVCFEIDIIGDTVFGEENPCKSTQKYFSVVGYGIARLVEDEDKKRDALNIIMKQSFKDLKKKFKFPKEMMESIVVYEIDVMSWDGKRNNN